MTHVLHLTAWHPYIDGVAGVFVLEQCAALQEAGNNVGLIFSRVEGLRGFSRQRLLRGIPGFVKSDLPIRTLGFKTWNVPGGSRFVSRFNARMLQNRYDAYVDAYGRPDILHAHVALEAGVAARQIAARTGLDYVLTEHSSEILNGPTPKRREKASAVYADARSVVAVSPVLASRIQEVCPTAKVKVIGCMVRDAVFSCRSPHRKSGKQIRIASIGALIPDKRTHHVIAVLARLPKALKQRIDYVIMGDGPERAKLEAAARAAGIRATFHGNLAHDRAMAELAEADFLIHASAYECFGTVMAEAMALGLPVVSTRSGGPESYVTNESGILVDVDDIDALFAATQTMIQDIETWRSRGDMIARRGRDLWHETNIASAITRLYE